MNTLRIVGYALLLFFFVAFKPISACEYAGSNINFVKTQTEKALAKDDLNLIRYYTFKALNALEKSKKELEACKCEYASISVEESAYLLKRATRADDIKDSKDLLKRALRNTVSGIDALQIHDEQHITKKPEDLLAINDDRGANLDEGLGNSENIPFKEKLDASLEKYRKSLDKVVRTVNCNDAKAFAKAIYENCEQELLTKGLSEQKKYYNLRTQEITAEALIRIQEKCND
ncbi:hypothetical protein FGM00_12145 [Aggregatimonas sangjinii]|uniref:Uncharacterized protein n=1 Tax=Aggregatimonas sangjinii TaxID=2583587 RepID=A0A5B7SUI0_9FLAO|nr:hypothetical protein [Aggregatimonas sangjinii]QCX00823.1 hypothetical protein FGM00_12145 [Aggregatimonas sangjinii]